MLVGEPAWVTPTGRGCGRAARVRRVAPRLGVLLHTAAVNDVRLHIQARSPDAEWVQRACSGAGPPCGGAPPDGVVVTEGRRVAIEVELTVKSERRVTAILDELPAASTQCSTSVPPARTGS